MNALPQLEQGVLAEGQEWTRRREQRLRAESEPLESLCPQSGQWPQDVRWGELQMHTVVGTVQLRVRSGHSATLGRWVCAARWQWGLAAHQRLSPKLEARLARTAGETAS